MTDKLKESISALMDNELSEIELHRLLRQYSEADSTTIIESCMTYQQIRVASNPASIKSSTLSIDAHFDTKTHIALHRRISAAIENESSISGELASTKSDYLSLKSKPLTKTTSRSWLKPASGFAVAASVVVAVLVGINQSSLNDGATLVDTKTVVNSKTLVDSKIIASAKTDQGASQFSQTPVEVQMVTNEVSNSVTKPVTQRVAGSFSNIVETPFETENGELELRELDAEKQNRLRDYLNRHERMTKNNPYARTVIFTKPNGGN